MTPLIIDVVEIDTFISMQDGGNPYDKGYVEVWTQAGFGRVDPNSWGSKIPVISMPNPCVFWFDDDGETFWICPQGKWQVTNAGQLISDSWRLMNFLVNKSYRRPVSVSPAFWSRILDVIYPGIDPETIGISLE